MAQIFQFPKSHRFTARWQAATRHIEYGNLRDALDVLEGLAAEGYVEAYAEIGNVYENGGNDAEQDFAQACRWYRLAIDAFDDPHGHVGIARVIINGYNEAGTIDEALSHLNHAANSGNPIAMTILGSLFHGGRLVDKDLQKAVSFYDRAIAAGYILPMVYLGKLYWEQRRFVSSLRMRLRAAREAFRLSRNDPSDPRLWQVRA